MFQRHLTKLLFLIIVLNISSACAQNGRTSLPEMVTHAKSGYLAICNQPREKGPAERWGMINYDGEVIFDGTSKWIEPVGSEWGFPYFTNSADFSIYGEKGKGLGLINKDNLVVVKPSFKAVRLFKDYSLGLDSKTGEVSVIHLPSLSVIERFKPAFPIEDVRGISEGKILTEKDGKFAFYDLKGNMVISPEKLQKYYEVYDFHDGRAAVCGEYNGEDAVGYIDEEGREIVSPQYLYEPSWGEDYFNFSDGRAIVTNLDVKAGVIDKDGKVVIPFIYKSIDPFRNGKAKAEYEDESQPSGYATKWIDINGNETTPGETESQNTELYPFEDEDNDKAGYKDSGDKVRIKPIYESAGYFINGHAFVKKDGKVSLIDSSGKVILENIAKNYWVL